MIIKFVTREGREIVLRRSRKAAATRLAFLVESECNTLRVAPTDSGSVRFALNAEAEATRAALLAARGAA